MPDQPTIRICHLQVLPLMSGVQRAMLAILDQLDRDRFEPHVICRGPGPLTEELAARQIAWHAVPELDRPIWPLKDYRAYCSLRNLFRRHRFQLVHTHSSKPGLLGRLAARHERVPITVHHVHAFAFHEFSSSLQTLVYSAIERSAAQLCDHMLFVNHEERTLVVRRRWLADERCTSVYNGVDLALAEAGRRAGHRTGFRAAHGIGEHELMILFSGRLAYPKQPLLLAEIAARLEHLRPQIAWRLVVVGNGEDEDALRKRVADRGVAHRVTLLGWHKDSWPALCAADIALQTSLAEGLPLALIEAHAAGLPSVASRAKGNREVVTAETGFLCPPRDPQSYAVHLAELVDNQPLRERLGAAARRRAERYFDTRRNSRQIVELYEKLLAGKRLQCPAVPVRVKGNRLPRAA